MSSTEEAHALVVGIRERGGPECAIESTTFNAAHYLRDLRQKASTGVNHPVHGPFWRQVQMKYALLESVLSDHAQRQQLLAQLKAQRAEGRRQALARVTRALDVLCADGQKTITTQEHLHLVKAYTGESGVSAEELSRLLESRGITVAKPAAEQKIAFLSDGDMTRMATELQVFGASTLYQFLKVPESAQLGDIKAAIGAHKTTWQSKKVSHEKTTAQSLLSRCDMYFANGAARARYDLSHAKHVLGREGVLHDLELATLDGVLEASELSQLTKHGVALGLSERNVRRVMVALATEARVIVREASAPTTPSKSQVAKAQTGSTTTRPASTTTPTRPTTTKPTTQPAAKPATSKPTTQATPKPVTPPVPKPAATSKTQPATSTARSASQPAPRGLPKHTVWLVPAVVFAVLTGALMTADMSADLIDPNLTEYAYYLAWSISAGLVGVMFKRGPQVAATSGITAWLANTAWGFVGIPYAIVPAVVVWFSCKALKSRGGSPLLAGVAAGVIVYFERLYMGVVDQSFGLTQDLYIAVRVLMMTAAFVAFAFWGYRQGRKGNLTIR